MTVPYINSKMERWALSDPRQLRVTAGDVKGVYVYRESARQQRFAFEEQEPAARRSLSSYSDMELQGLYAATAVEDIEVAEEDIQAYGRSLVRLDEE